MSVLLRKPGVLDTAIIATQELWLRSPYGNSLEKINLHSSSPPKMLEVMVQCIKGSCFLGFFFFSYHYKFKNTLTIHKSLIITNTD
jgi:hypothetical protein